MKILWIALTSLYEAGGVGFTTIITTQVRKQASDANVVFGVNYTVLQNVLASVCFLAKIHTRANAAQSGFPATSVEINMVSFCFNRS